MNFWVSAMELAQGRQLEVVCVLMGQEYKHQVFCPTLDILPANTHVNGDGSVDNDAVSTVSGTDNLIIHALLLIQSDGDRLCIGTVKVLHFLIGGNAQKNVGTMNSCEESGGTVHHHLYRHGLPLGTGFV